MPQGKNALLRSNADHVDFSSCVTDDETLRLGSGRKVLNPLLVHAGTGIVMSLLAAGAFRVPAGDPLFLFVLLLSHSTPTAMNLQTVATLNQNGEEEMSCLLCWQYLASLITLPLWMCLFVVLVSPYA